MQYTIIALIIFSTILSSSAQKVTQLKNDRDDGLLITSDIRGLNHMLNDKFFTYGRKVQLFPDELSFYSIHSMDSVTTLIDRSGDADLDPRDKGIYGFTDSRVLFRMNDVGDIYSTKGSMSDVKVFGDIAFSINCRRYKGRVIGLYYIPDLELPYFTLFFEDEDEYTDWWFFDSETGAEVVADHVIIYDNELIIAGRDHFSDQGDKLDNFKIKNISDLDYNFDWKELRQEIIFEGESNTDYDLNAFYKDKPYYLLTSVDGDQKVLTGTAEPLENVTDQFAVNGKIQTIDNINTTKGERSEDYLLLTYEENQSDVVRHVFIDTENGFAQTQVEVLDGKELRNVFIYPERKELYVLPKDPEIQLMIIDVESQSIIETFSSPGNNYYSPYRINASGDQVYFAMKHPSDAIMVAGGYNVNTQEAYYLNEGSEYITSPIRFYPGSESVYIEGEYNVGRNETYLWKYFKQSSTATNSVERSKQLHVRPNPFSDKLTVKCSEQSCKENYIRIYSMNGRLVQEDQFHTNGMIEISTGMWNKGLYLVLVYDKLGKVVHTKKVLNN